MSAAKSYFDAFSSRIQAYEFEQVVGLISFNDKISVEMPLTELLDEFEVSA